MTHTAGVNAAILAASMKAERHIVETLRQAEALTAGAAIAMTPGRMIQRGALRRLVRRGAVRQTGDRYWLDEAGLTTMTDRRRGMARLILGYAAGVAVALIALALWMRLG